MRILLFKPEFVPLILKRRKTVTRQGRAKGFKKGDRVLAKTSYRGKAFALLEIIEDERREPLQDITAAECYAEGISLLKHSPWWQFARIWDEINTKPEGQFAANPEVSRIAFRLIERRADQ